MYRTFYSEYVAHCMRHYSRYCDTRTASECHSKAEETNWNTCIQTLSQLPQRDRDIILDLYREKNDFTEAVKAVSEKYEIPQNAVWHINSLFATEFARNRGLI